MKSIPANKAAKSTFSRFGATCSTRMKEIRIAAPMNRAAHKRIDQRRTDGVKQPADGRTDNGCGLVRRGRACDRARQYRQRHQPRQQRLQGRRLEGAAGAEHEDQRQDQLAGQKSVKGADREQQRGAAFDELREPHHAAAVVAIRDRARDQHQQESRNELRKPDQAEIERAAGHLVDLPADRHDLHLQAQGSPIPARTRTGRRDGNGGSGYRAQAWSCVFRPSIRRPASAWHRFATWDRRLRSIKALPFVKCVGPRSRSDCEAWRPRLHHNSTHNLRRVSPRAIGTPHGSATLL